MSTYTNTGDYYYKTPVEGETHTITTTSVDYSVTTVTYDEDTIEMTGDSAYILPLVLYTSSTTGHDILFEVSYAPDIINNVAVPYAEAALVDLNEMDSEIWYNYTINIDGENITVRWGSGANQYETGVVKFFLANEGEYVLSESPVIKEDTTYYLADMYQEMREPAQGGDTNYGIVSVGTSTEIATPPFPTIDKMSGHLLDYSGVSTQIDKTENTYGVKMDGIEIHSVWKKRTDATQTLDLDWTAKKMIVPVTVESEGPDPDVPNIAKNVSHSTYVGWSAFRKAQLTDAEVTNGAVDLTDAFGKNTTVTEILGIQSDIYVSFDFDPKTQKLKLYTATNTPASGTATVVILALAS